MSRRRYISTEISDDKAVNQLARDHGDFAALLYTWMIPHCEDSAILHGDTETILVKVLPFRRDVQPERVEEALNAMVLLRLIEWDREREEVKFPPTAFYKYQTYVPEGKRRTAQNTDKQRSSGENAVGSALSGENAAYPSPSPSPSKDSALPAADAELSEEQKEPVKQARKGKLADPKGFTEFWARYRLLNPRERSTAVTEWKALKVDGPLYRQIMCALEVQAQEHCRKLEANQFSPEWLYAVRWLKRRRWEDEADSAPPDLHAQNEPSVNQTEEFRQWQQKRKKNQES